MGTLYRRKGSPKWYGEYTDALGKRIQKSTGTSVKRDAEAILKRWESDANNERHGIAVPRSTTIQELLAEYVKFLGSTTVAYRDATENRIQRVLDACEFVYPRDIDRIAVENCVREFQTKLSKQSIGLRTQSHYLTAMKGFTKWLATVRKALVTDPLAATKKPNFEKDRKKKRRFLTREEWVWLRKTEHSLLYETAIQTGLRSSELRALKPSNLKTNCIALDAKHTKNGKPAQQFISEILHARLREALPFQMPVIGEVARMFYRDLEAARQLWLGTLPEEDRTKLVQSQEFLCRKNSAGEELDFHALRHTCGAWLAIAGVNVKVIQSVMRHSSITLTLDTYGHLLPGAEEDAAAQLSVFLSQ
jgi:integrase